MRYLTEVDEEEGEEEDEEGDEEYLNTRKRKRKGREEGGEEALYCYCRQVSYGEMVGCDNEVNCSFSREEREAYICCA